jgi:ATP-binding protein involved in chromosome partitioning
MRRYGDILGDGGSGVVAQVAERQARIRARLARIRHTVAVLSGKGGVGKSTLAGNLAVALAQRGLAVGVLDADLNGPSMAKILGVRDQRPAFSADGVLPAVGPLGIRVLSMDLLLPADETPVLWQGPGQQGGFVWRGTAEVSALREFLGDTAWGELDVLLVDLPPGSDRIPNLVGLVPDLDGCLIVTAPSGVSQLVVKKSVTMVRDVLKAPALGLVENMGPFACPHCGAVEPLFPGPSSLAVAEALGIPFLGTIPFDPRLAFAADAGTPYLAVHADAPAGRALTALADRVMAACDDR